MANKKIIFLSITLIICAFIIFSKRVNHSKSVEKKVIFTQKEVVIDEAHFLFKPIFEKKNELEKLKVLIEITSYIDEELLHFNYKKNSMLEFNEHFLQAKEFQVIEKTNHKLIGHLIFELSKFNVTEPFGIKLFTYSDNEVYWN